MKRITAFGLGIAGVALAGLPMIASAADFPPSPPTTYYGSAGGATNGQKVIAFVSSGTNTVACGEGVVTNDASAGLVYVVDVAADSQIPGCGLAGRQVTFYFPPSPGSGGRLSSNNATWQDAGPRKFDITLGSPLTPRSVVPQAARDGVN